MTKLSAYIQASKVSQAKLAEAVGVSRSYMSQIVAGDRTPSLSVAVAIERATKGKVKVAALLEPRQ